jgi:DNA polymerase-3 subunit delta'
MSKQDEEEVDPREGPLHPRHRRHIHGHEAAERRLLDAYHSGKFHHAWLLTGPKGVGKATLAYRLAKYLLRYPDASSAPPDSLSLPDGDTVAAQVDARAHPDLLVIQREVEKGKLKAGINVTVSRKAASFFSKTAGAGGWRVAIVDAVEDMNIASANAILKTLEEPPENSVFILVCNQRGRILPTIRSRCIELPLAPLPDESVGAALDSLPGDLAAAAAKLVEQAQGSPGFALELAETGAGRIFSRFAQAAERGAVDQMTRMQVATELYGRGTDDRFRLFCGLLEGWLVTAARQAAATPATADRALALAQAHGRITHSIRETNALNLDRRLTVLQAFDLIDKARRA